MGQEWYKAFVILTGDMRAKQKEYFKTRDANTLNMAKDLEKAVDRLLEEYEDSKYGGKLFP